MVLPPLRCALPRLSIGVQNSLANYCNFPGVSGKLRTGMRVVCAPQLSGSAVGLTAQQQRLIKSIFPSASINFTGSY